MFEREAARIGRFQTFARSLATIVQPIMAIESAGTC